MPKYLIEARGPGAAQATPDQIANMDQGARQLQADPRVIEIFGVTTKSIGFCAIVEGKLEDAERVAGMAALYGFPETSITPLVDPQQWRAGLQDAAHAAPASVGARQRSSSN